MNRQEPNRSMSSPSPAMVVALAALLGLGACQGPSETAQPTQSSPGKAGRGDVTPGVPAGGPDVLYAPPADIPQVQNRDPRFRAPFEMVAGTERYVDGEYLYSDFIYDDESTAAYPDDFERYANNAADLVEFRMSARGQGSLAARFTLNTFLVEDSTIAVVAFDSDNDANTGSSTLPRDPGMPFPGTDQVLTTWGAGAEWSRWNGTGWDTVPLEVHADLEANQITVTVPKSAADPHGQWRATLATGLYDPATGGWLATAVRVPISSPAVLPIHAPTSVSSPAPLPLSKIFNLGFRFNETQVSPPHGKQGAALSASAPTQFANPIDFDLLRSHGARDNVPMHGAIHRIYASRIPSLTLKRDGGPGEYGDRPFSEGKNRFYDTQYISPLQPYVVYVPESYRPDQPAPMTFALHGGDGEYYWTVGSLIHKYLGDDRNGIVLSPTSRGGRGYYVGDLEYGLFEAWNDVARHYALDPRRTSVYGLSMGGYAAYVLGLLHPHLFASAVPYIPAICKNIWLVAACASEEGTQANRWVENARNLPIFHIADSLSEATFYPGQHQQVLGPAVNGLQSLDALGYRYKFWSVAMDHAMGVALRHDFLPAIGEFLGQREIEPEPFHVSYARLPSSDLPERNLIHNRAYWLSGIEVRDASDPLAKGVIDALSLGFGRSDPSSAQAVAPGVVSVVAYVETERTWSEPGTVPVENRIVIKATNIGSVTIDPAAARVGCDVQLDIESDGPLEVTLLGCKG
jgi:hypothetical protein